MGKSFKYARGFMELEVYKLARSLSNGTFQLK